MLNADMMVWGHVAGADKVLHLTVTPRVSEKDHGGRRYLLDERTLSLPPDFTGDLGAAIAALLIGEAGKLIEGSGGYIAPLAREVADRCDRVLSGSLPGNGRCGSRAAEGGGRPRKSNVVVGTQAGEEDRLRQAIDGFRAAIADFAREGAKGDVARNQNALGSALRTLGARESGTARLEEAVAAYPAALEERTRERVPLSWAMTQNNLGSGLQTLGARERHRPAGGGRCLLSRRAGGVDARARAAAMGWDPEQSRQGARDARRARERHRPAGGGGRRLSRRAEERMRERVPLNWARTHSNLGTALIAFFDRSGSLVHLDRAEEHVHAALEVFRQAGAGQYIGMAEEQLSRKPSGVRVAPGERVLSRA